MPLHHVHDRNQKWSRMVGDDLVYVYREGTMELSPTNKNAVQNKDQNPVLCVVPWTNINDKML